MDHGARICRDFRRGARRAGAGLNARHFDRKVAGWTGALVATAALFIPSSIMCLGIAKVWNRYRGHAWHAAFETGLAPIGTGLMFAGVLVIFKLADAGPLSWALAAFVAAVLTFRPKVHPMILLLVGAVVFNLDLFLKAA
jgi:chromate transporter